MTAYLRSGLFNLIILISLIPSIQAMAAQMPLWVGAYQEGSLVSEDSYLGVGSANYTSNRPDHECRRLSKDRALDDLSYQLSVSITSQLEENLSQKGKFSQEQISSSLFVSTRKVLSGIKEKQKWTDPSEQRHGVLLTIDKQSADRQVQQQDFINEVVDRLEKNQTEIKQGVEKLNRLVSEHTQRINQRMQNMEGLLNKINNKLDSTGNDAQQEYKPLVQKIQQIEKQWQSQAQSAREQSEQMSYLMYQNQTLSQQLAQMLEIIQKDHYLPFLADDVKTQMSNQDFEVTITPAKGQNARYVEGETIRFLVSANRDCFIKVIYLSSINGNSRNETRMNTLLFPNFYDRNNQIKANQTVIIGRKDELTVEPPFGKDVITVVASTTQFEDMETLLKKAAEQYYSYETRSIQGAVEARGIGVKKQAETVTDTCFIVSRPN